MISSWQPIIGLEVHVELKTKSKMFCSCFNKHFQQKPNTNTCPVCLGLPGALPCPNQKAIQNTILIALALNSKINLKFWFDRKNYFYPDLPKGYQISQHFYPIGKNGKVPTLVNGKAKTIFLDNIHLEEDTGKLIHTEKETLIDYNRSGVPLVEIVTKPCLRSGEEAKSYLKRLQQILRWLEVSDCDMEKGSMRLEANISVAPTKDSPLPNYKVEIKNLNSFKFVEKAIDYEIKRQIQILKKNETPKQETRGFNPKKGTTYSQRSKEAAKDYRYFPEPDIPPFEFAKEEIEKLEKGLPRMPWELEKELIKSGVPLKWILILTKTKRTTHLLRRTIEKGKGRFSPEEIAKLLTNRPKTRNKSPGEILKTLQLDKSKFSLSEKEIIKFVKEIIEEQPKAVRDFKKGKSQVLGFLIGQVQAKARGKADPKFTAKIIAKELKKHP